MFNTNRFHRKETSFPAQMGVIIVIVTAVTTAASRGALWVFTVTTQRQGGLNSQKECCGGPTHGKISPMNAPGLFGQSRRF